MLIIQKLLQTGRLSTGRRFFNKSSKCLDSKASDSTVKTSSSTPNVSSSSVNESVMGPRMRAPSDFDKFILVWMKKFPKGQVPERVSEEVVYQTKSRARVRIANYMMITCIVMFAITAYFGKQAQKKGDSIQKRNMEWHQKINEEHQAKLKKEAEEQAKLKSNAE